MSTRSTPTVSVSLNQRGLVGRSFSSAVLNYRPDFGDPGNPPGRQKSLFETLTCTLPDRTTFVLTSYVDLVMTNCMNKDPMITCDRSVWRPVRGRDCGTDIMGVRDREGYER